MLAGLQHQGSQAATFGTFIPGHQLYCRQSWVKWFLVRVVRAEWQPGPPKDDYDFDYGTDLVLDQIELQ